MNKTLLQTLGENDKNDTACIKCLIFFHLTDITDIRFDPPWRNTSKNWQDSLAFSQDSLRTPLSENRPDREWLGIYALNDDTSWVVSVIAVLAVIATIENSNVLWNIPGAHDDETRKHWASELLTTLFGLGLRASSSRKFRSKLGRFF